MGSLRTLFLGVYTSNVIIRTLFLPSFYVLLFSPFLTLAGWYLGFGQTIKMYIPEDFSWFDLLPQIAVLTVVVLLPTRLLSGSGGVSKSTDGKRRAQSLPYWIPGVRHFWSIISGGEAWLNGVRNSTFESIVTYNAFGSKHNIVLNDTLTEDSILAQISNQSSNLEVPDTTKWAVLRNAFSIPSNAKPQYFQIESDIEKSVVAEVYEQMLALMSPTLNTLSESLPDFVTFNSSIVDQMQWERVANVELSDGTSEAECDLFALVNEFCCNAILPPIVGSQFTESYQLLATDLAAFNSRYWALALGLPRLSPIQGLPGAALSQKRLVYNFTRMFSELANPPVRRVPDDDESVSGEETDADVLTPVVKLNELFTKHDLSLNARASITLQLVHDIVAEVVPLVFWTLMHVYASSEGPAAEAFGVIPIGKIIAETKAWAQAFQPPSIHPAFPSPPAIIFDPTFSQLPADLMPYLHSCMNESRRLYSCSALTYLIKSPITLSDPNPSVQQETWILDANSYLDIGLSQSLISSSPAIFPDPTSYKPDRFTTSPPTPPTSPSHLYKSALVLAILTGIFQLWEISPAPKKSFFDHMQEAREEAQIRAAPLTSERLEAKDAQLKEKREKEGKVEKWVMPKAVDGASIKIPKADVRVRIRRREGLPAGGFGMRRVG
ncbi:hypothetical protein HBI73_035510 [Parastagonospora nodorum]|nr:hypothetical protein HBI73_035510 [Parastagonospora nodorum]